MLSASLPPQLFSSSLSLPHSSSARRLPAGRAVQPLVELCEPLVIKTKPPPRPEERSLTNKALYEGSVDTHTHTHTHRYMHQPLLGQYTAKKAVVLWIILTSIKGLICKNSTLKCVKQLDTWDVCIEYVLSLIYFSQQSWLLTGGLSHQVIAKISYHCT